MNHSMPIEMGDRVTIETGLAGIVTAKISFRSALKYRVLLDDGTTRHRPADMIKHEIKGDK
ncbi:MAG: hypothetical protein JRC86_02885 [Deltaproteobacteria bacterium]|nr:hypothetical protein [Deltaproteobacteria bacterium]